MGTMPFVYSVTCVEFTPENKVDKWTNKGILFAMDYAEAARILMEYAGDSMESMQLEAIADYGPLELSSEILDQIIAYDPYK